MARKQVWRDYYVENGDLRKDNIDERRHLVQRLGGVPAIDAALWDRLYPREVSGRIVITTASGRVFSIAAGLFDEKKMFLDDGYGRQYWVPRALWGFENPAQIDLFL